MVMLPAAEATVWHTFASNCVNGTLGFIALNSPIDTAAASTLFVGGEEERGASSDTLLC
jgi:hypothetical protein